MASWDPAADVETGRVGLRCLACGRPLDEALAVAGSLRCLDCRESNAVLKTQLAARKGTRVEDRLGDVAADLPLE